MAALNETTGENMIQDGGHFGWEQMRTFQQNRTALVTYNTAEDPPEMGWFITPPPQDSLDYLFVVFAIYFLLAWYFSQVLTGGEARPQPILFPFLPRYWFTSYFAKLDGGSTAGGRCRRALPGPLP